MPDAGLQQGTARAEQLRGTGQRTRVERAGYRAGHRGASGQHLAASHLRQRPARVHGPIPGTRSGEPHRVTRGKQDKAGDAGVHRPRQPRRHGRRGDQFPGGQPGEPRNGPASNGEIPSGRVPVGRIPGGQVGGLCASGKRGEEHGNGGDRLGHRAGNGVMPEFLAGDRDVGDAGAETAVVLGHRQRRDP